MPIPTAEVQEVGLKMATQSFEEANCALAELASARRESSRPL